MQRNGVRINESHINTIALKARLDSRECGYLWKKSNDLGGKWQLKWFALYQNFLFYYENVNSTKPVGLIILESCYCDRNMTNTKSSKEGEIKLVRTLWVRTFPVRNFVGIEIHNYTKDGKNQLELGAESEDECNQWVESIKNCSYNMQSSLNVELHQKYVHLSQLYETESQTRWQYLSQIEELSNEVKQLRDELKRFKNQHHLLRSKTIADEENHDMKRIKKVQSLCRGWLYRRRWKRIVKDYIESPQALNLRKRNRIVFELVEKEGEYMSQLETLVSNFLRPFKMAACSNKPPITHEEINCIFLNSEILLFLHQIFYKGLQKKLENWPTLFIGDIFDFLLPVLVIYQEYVRNHHYSLQILTELKSKSITFRALLKRYEEKSVCEGRSLDTFLTYPMHQIPRYILILHELIAYTSHSSTNELKTLENAKTKLEELSRTMHDEVSETENIRYNLSIEKMIVEGCECLLDANQVFIREGLLIMLTTFKTKTLGVKFKNVKKRSILKCFLFTNHLILTTRASNGRLNLFKPYEAIPLSGCRVVEEVNDASLMEDENASVVSEDHSIISASGVTSDSSSISSLFFSNKDQPNDTTCEFKLVLSNTNYNSNIKSRIIHFIASSVDEKQSWCSDISQCVDNLNYSSLLQNTNTSNSVNMPNKATLIDDPKLFKDEVDVKYCKTLNSCKIPQIRQATVEKLIERLTDLRFLSIDFLNTFLLTYRVFTEPFVVINALKALYESSPRHSIDLNDSEYAVKFESANINELNRRISGAGIYKLPSINEEHDILSYRRDESDDDYFDYTKLYKNTSNFNQNDSLPYMPTQNDIKQFQGLPVPVENGIEHKHDEIKFIDTCESDESQIDYVNEPIKINGMSKEPIKLTPVTVNKPHIHNIEIFLSQAAKINVTDGIININKLPVKSKNALFSNKNGDSINNVEHSNNYNDLSEETNEFPKGIKTKNWFSEKCSSNSSLNASISSATSSASKLTYWKDSAKLSSTTEALALSPAMSLKNPNKLTKNLINNQFISSIQQNKLEKRLSNALACQKISEKLAENPRNLPISIYAGAVVTSSRWSRRRISNHNATKAFAVATSGSQTSLESKPSTKASIDLGHKFSLSTSNRIDRTNSTNPSTGLPSEINTNKTRSEWAIVNTAASMRVLNVLRHWVTKHPIDFDENLKLKEETINLVSDILNDPHITETEKKVAQGIIQQLNIPTEKKKELSVNIDLLLSPPLTPRKVKFNELSVSEIAEQMTYIDYQIFCSISSHELLGQAWMKPGKEFKAKNVLLFSKRFNEMSQLVVTEIVNSADNLERIEKLEKWTTIANICKFLKNFNGVLQIMSAFATTSVFRLKKTWEKLTKNTQQTIDSLQSLVSSDGRFRNLRDAMHKSDPPCIPYLGMYLMDLVFIEESTPDMLEGNLVNFSKLRIVSHIMRDIRSFQHAKYTIHHNRRVCEYLLDTSELLSPEDAYNKSLMVEPRNSFINILDNQKAGF